MVCADVLWGGASEQTRGFFQREKLTPAAGEDTKNLIHYIQIRISDLIF